jgi:DnaK suppressor protein
VIANPEDDMTRKSDLRLIRQLLEERRAKLLSTAHGTRQELMDLKSAERDPEYEEGAQAELADYTLSHLLETHRLELQLIDGALRRLEDGSYGECLDCGNDIPFERLKALPFAVRCAEDAVLHERRVHGAHYATPSL